MKMNLLWSDEVTQQLAKLADLDAIAPEMLQSAAPIDPMRQKQEAVNTKSHCK